MPLSDLVAAQPYNYVRAPNTRPGVYTVYISVGRSDGSPVFELPLADNDGHKRYRLGEIEITERPE